MAPRSWWLACSLAVAAVVAACDVVPGRAPEAGTETQVELGRELIQRYGCGSCHTIPGIRGANGLVAPPLTNFSQRAYVAGALPNTPENVARWVQDPPSIEPGTAMPVLGVTEEEAGNIAAYLHSIK
ncbi:MAG: cytochrome c [Actinobacteria bacterium]|nr:cytochrome c [Actinomycetota bacterium]